MATYYTIKLRTLDGETPNEPFIMHTGDCMPLSSMFSESAKSLGESYAQHLETSQGSMAHTVSYEPPFDLVRVSQRLFRVEKLGAVEQDDFEMAVTCGLERRF